MAGEVSVTLTYSRSNGSPSDPKDLLTTCCRNLSVLARMENFPGICPLISNILRADPGKENAVITGRKAWGSIPAEHRPLHVVLTHRKNFNIGTAENVVKYGIMCIALYLLPLLLSIEKVSVIGGGQRFLNICS